MDLDDLKEFVEEFVAEHLLITQRKCWECSLRIPLIVRIPVLARRTGWRRLSRNVGSYRGKMLWGFYWHCPEHSAEARAREGAAKSKPRGREPEGRCAVCQRNTYALFDLDPDKFDINESVGLRCMECGNVVCKGCVDRGHRRCPKRHGDTSVFSQGPVR